MVKYFLLLWVVIAGALISMYRWVGVPPVFKEPRPAVRVPHHAQNPSQGLGEVILTLFYFVPRNKTALSDSQWRPLLEAHLEQLRAFHHLQLQGRSRLGYEVYPRAIIGREENLVYDTDTTEHGNPEALRRIAGELEKRVFRPEGDLYQAAFGRVPEAGYRVMAILYEGVGASGSENAALLSRTFLTEPEYQAASTSLLAHEFYHTLGLADAYDLKTAVAKSQDLMGLGRNQPIESTYLGRSALEALGL